MTDSSKVISRRNFLLGATATGAAALLASCRPANRNSETRQAGNRGIGRLLGRSASIAEFINPLAIPPLAHSTVQGDQRIFELTAQTGTREILPGQQTQTWGFNGAILGPTLRARRGEEVAIHFRNELNETTTVHWHGMHLPAEMDGGPHQPVAPGETWRSHWQIKQPAATLWYHPHPHGETEKHVFRGLAGLFIIDDDDSDALGLPADYGVNDIPVIVQDKVFDGGGQLRLGDHSETGMLGDTILVNGVYAPYLDVTSSKVRLRILNGSTARIYNFGFDDDRDFLLIGTDGGLLTAPHLTDRIQLSPGERAEIIVELQPNTEPILRSYPPDLGRTVLPRSLNGGNDSFDILQLRAGARLQPLPDVPAMLATIEPLSAHEASRTREFRLAGRKINGQHMDMHRIDEIVTVDSTEIWEVFTTDLSPHNFHIHDVQFQILDINGNSPPPELAGWKDTVYLSPRTTYRLIMRFEDYTSLDIPYECITVICSGMKTRA